MDFYGEVIKEGVGDGVWILDTKLGRSKTYFYNIAFQCTNNVAEYEALFGVAVIEEIRRQNNFNPWRFRTHHKSNQRRVFN